MDKEKPLQKPLEQTCHVGAESDSNMHEDTDAEKQKRRKLLKGAAALPVVMTLYSGAALARTSNITGEATSVLEAVFVDTIDGPQLLCVFPQQKLDNGAYDLGDTPHYALISDPKIQLHASEQVIMEKKMQQLENCHLMGGIMISGTAFTSIAAKTGAFDSLITL